MNIAIAYDNYLAHLADNQYRGRDERDEDEDEDAEDFDLDEISPVDEEEFHWQFIKDKGEPQ